MLMITTRQAIRHRETETAGPELNRLYLLHDTLLRASASAALLQHQWQPPQTPAKRPAPAYCLGDHVYDTNDQP